MLRMRTVTGWLLVAISLWLAGCGGGPRMLMPTPRLYQQLEQELFAELAPSLQEGSFGERQRQGLINWQEKAYA